MTARGPLAAPAWALVRALACAWVLGACAPAPAPPPPPEPAAATPDPHAAGGACESCHAAEATAWEGSHHALASSEVLELDRFDGKPVRAGAIVATPLLEAGAPVLRVKDGAGTRTWPVRGRIGVAPLQQYLLDAERGRVLVAPIAWDVGAGRWFDPAPEGGVADPADPLYWAGLAGNWNHQCGECHTTGYQKGYDAATDSYHTVTTHPSVTCQACHGTGDPLPLTASTDQVQACAPCHSRRATLAYGAGPADSFLDHHRPELIGSDALTAEGRNAAPAEPFEWAAFVQSRKYAAGIRCSDCHDPHSGKTRAEPQALCLGCHPAVPHPERTDDCVGCHMPTSRYMVIHARHDHGMRIPGDRGHAAVYAPALAGDPAAVPDLVRLAADPTATAFDRASAAGLLRRFPPADAAALRKLLASADPLLRVEAVATLGAWGHADVATAALGDRSRAVRYAALEALVALRVPASSVPQRAVVADYEANARSRGDIPGAWQNLALVRAWAGDNPGMIEALRAASQRDPNNLQLRRALESLDGR